MKKSIVLWVCSVLILSMTGLVIWLSKYGIAAIFLFLYVLLPFYKYIRFVISGLLGIGVIIQYWSEELQIAGLST